MKGIYPVSDAHSGLGRKTLVLAACLIMAGSVLPAHAEQGTSIEAQAQQGRKKLTGVVRDAQGEPIIGASVSVVGTGVGAVTDLDGNFTLQVPANAQRVLVKYLGYKDVELSISGKSNVDVVLVEDAGQLDQVVVTGYATQKRSEMTTSIAKLDNNSLQSSPRSNVATALQGTVPGLRVTQTTGQPGSTPTITLRGGTDFNGNGTPLILVDGVPSSFWGLSQDDIESIEVLKDAAATAIYGARAANGVIVVTTKKGREGHSSITVRTKFTTNARRDNGVDYADAPTFIKYLRQGVAHYRTVTGQPGQFPAFLTGVNAAATGNNTTNSIYTTMILSDANRYLLSKPGWQTMVDPLDPSQTLIFQDNSGKFYDAAFQSSHAEDFSVSFEGGNDKGTYYLGLNSLNDKGLAIDTSFKRYGVTFNGSYNLTNRLKVSSSIMYSQSDSKSPYVSAEQLFQRSAGQAPTARFWYTEADGTDSNRPYPGTAFHFGNALYYSEKYDSHTINQRLTGNAQLDYKILPNLTFTLRGMHFSDTNNSEGFQKLLITGGSTDASRTSSASFSRTQRNQLTALLNYNLRIKEKHNISALLGGEYFEEDAYSMSASTKNSPTDLIATMNFGAEASGVPSSSKSAYGIASVFGQVNYDYMGRYLAGFTFRNDGTSRLANDKWGFFPGISLGWNAHREDFYKNLGIDKVLSQFKPRFSYGVNGNIEVLGNYTVLGAYAVTAPYEGEKGFVNTSLPTLDLRWERSTTLNFGVDLGFFKNRITVMADFFVRNVMDKLAAQTLPVYTGFGSVTINNGTLQNRGIELQVNAKAIQSKDWNWNIGLNLAHIRNYAKSLPNNGVDNNRQGGIEVYVPGTNKTTYLGGIQQGYRIGTDEIVGYVFDGVYQTQAQLDAHKGRRVDFATNKTTQFLGDAIWRDINGDNVIDSRDQMSLGRLLPDLTGGISTDLSYKNWSLFVNTDFALGHKRVNIPYWRGLSQRQGNQGMPTDLARTWSPENPTGDLPRFTFTDPQHNYWANGDGVATGVNSLTVEDASYLALREITLSYTHSKPLFGGVLKSARFYATGTNLHYFTAYSGAQPEAAGIDNGTYPLPRSFTFGLNLTF